MATEVALVTDSVVMETDKIVDKVETGKLLVSGKVIVTLDMLSDPIIEEV